MPSACADAEKAPWSPVLAHAPWRPCIHMKNGLCTRTQMIWGGNYWLSSFTNLCLCDITRHTHTWGQSPPRPAPRNAKQGAPALSYSYSCKEKVRGSKANEVRGAIGSLLFYRACACVDVRIFTGAWTEACPLAMWKRGRYFALFLSLVSLNSSAPTRFNHVGVPLLFFVSIRRVRDNNKR